MSVDTQSISSLAAQASSIPGSDPALLARINSLAGSIGQEYHKTDGMDLGVVASSAGKVRGRGPHGSLTEHLLKFVYDVLVKVGSDGTADWFGSIGVSEDESAREGRESVQGDNACRLATEVDDCCRTIEDIDATADTAITGVVEVISALMMIMRIHPLGRVAALILPVVAQGFEQILGIVEDRNRQVETCLGTVTQSCQGMLEHQPEPSRQWQCPAPVAPGAEGSPAPAPAAAPAPAPEPQTQPVAGGAPSGGECPPAPAARAQPPAPVVPGECPPAPTPAQPPEPVVPEKCPPEAAPPAKPAPPPTPVVPASVDTGAQQCVDRLVCAPAPAPVGAPAAAPINISFNFDLGSAASTHTAALAPPTCDIAGQFAPPQQCPPPVLTGSSLQSGLGITLECLNRFAECLAEAAECPGETCCAHGGGEPPAPEPPASEPPAPEPPAPEPPAPEPPAPEPPAPEPPAPEPECTPIAEGTIPPPPELAEVPEPPPPAEKLRTASLLEPEPMVLEPAAPEPVVAPEPAQPAEQASPEPPAPAPAEPQKMRKTGQW